MTDSSEYRSLVAVCLMASFADGAKSEDERGKLLEVINGLGVADVNFSGVYHDVLLKKITLEQAVASISTPEMRTLAYEMAVLMCDADGASVPAEREFLSKLAGLLNLPESAASKVVAEADSAASMNMPADAETPVGVSSEPVLDGMIMRYAVLSGALELLPQSLASLAILPLQVKMVYRIGRHFGHTLDAGHVKEFITTIGAGMTGQMLDGVARKFMGRLAKGMAGALVGGFVRGATSAGVSFAATWAIGQVARQYYASGRRFNTGQLRGLFTSLQAQGQKLYTQHAEEVQKQSANLDIKQVLTGKLDAP